MTFTRLAPAPSSPPEPFTDQLRLVLAAYLARFTGSSREHTESDLRCYLAWYAECGLDHQDRPGPLAARRRPGHRPGSSRPGPRTDPAEHPRHPDGPARSHPPPAPPRPNRRHPGHQGAPAHAPSHLRPVSCTACRRTSPSGRRAPRHQRHHGLQGRLPRGSHQRPPGVHRPRPGPAPGRSSWPGGWRSGGARSRSARRCAASSRMGRRGMSCTRRSTRPSTGPSWAGCPASCQPGCCARAGGGAGRTGGRASAGRTGSSR